MPPGVPPLVRARSRSASPPPLQPVREAAAAGQLGDLPAPAALTRQRSGSDDEARRARPATASVSAGVAERGGRVRHRATQAVSVYCRWRPLSGRERASGVLPVEVASTGAGSFSVVDPLTSVPHEFAFNCSFEPSASQVEVFEVVAAPMVARVMGAFNCCCQT